MSILTVIRGGGDLASGVILRLARAGIRVVVTELPRPLAVRRKVAFAQAVYDGQIQIEDVKGIRVTSRTDIEAAWHEHAVPVLVDPDAQVLNWLHPDVFVDARMMKRAPDLGLATAQLVIGLGPGFVAGENCHAVVETKRGPFLGRVYWRGPAEPDSGSPDAVGEHQDDRVLRAPRDGLLRAHVEIGAHIETSQRIADVDGTPVLAPFSGRLRGLLADGMTVTAGVKIGDLDPRDDERLSFLVSDKSLAIGGAVLEAILSVPELRQKMCQKDQR